MEGCKGEVGELLLQTGKNESLDNDKYVNTIFVPLYAPLNKEKSWANKSCLMFMV